MAVQESGSLSDVVYAFDKAMEELRFQGLPEAELARHSIVKLFTFRLFSLAWGQDPTQPVSALEFARAYGACKDGSKSPNR